MSLIVRPTLDEAGVILHHDIVKLFEFEEPLSVADARGLCYGTPKQTKYICPRKQESKIVFCYLLEQMGGFSLLWHTFHQVEEDEEDQKIDAGFDFIESKASEIQAGPAMIRWIAKWTNKKKTNSPICGWEPGLVEKTLKSVKDGGVLAKVRDYLPLTMRSLNPVFLIYILGPLLCTLRKKSIVFLGENKIGKSPTAIVVAFALARFFVTLHGVVFEPRIRVAPDMDFFRGEPGTPYTPFIYDDGDMSEIETRKLKAFLDVGEEECMTRERWGASKFVKNQWRAICDNTYDADAMIDITADLSEDGSFAQISLAIFLDIIKPSFAKMSLPNIKAILKRAHVIVNTAHYILVKQAESDVVKVFRGLPSYLTTEAGANYMEWKDSGATPSSEQLREDIGWEQQWVARFFSAADRGAVVRRDVRARRWARGALAAQ